MRILIWATHLQTDILALALHLDASPGVELMIVAPGVDAYLAEPIAGARPLGCPIVDRDAPAARRIACAFGADVVVADNHLPPAGVAGRLLYMWHGLGWKARGSDDLKVLYRGVARLTGADPRKPNPRFVAQSYGEPDNLWRIERWGLHPGCCRIIGMAFSDLLLDPPLTREQLAPRYAIDVLARPTVLVSLTWHYGGIFASSGRRARDGEVDLLGRLLGAVRECGGNVLLCLHERKRYEDAYLASLQELAARFDHVQIKHKDEHPDNLSDLLVADVMLSNLSSFITYFYVLGRPSIHIHPGSSTAGGVRLARMSRNRVRYRTLGRDEPLWMCDPEDNGGLTVRGGDEAVDAVVRALGEPGCCRARSASWISRHVHAVDGRTAERLGKVLADLAGGG